jgi:predicted Rossmann fold flavoprotein
MKTDVIILGAGGAGMMCAIHAGHRGRRVLLLDHAPKIGGKILISGGGRCNFTNLGAKPANYVSKNPHFMKSALSRFRPEDFISQVEAHGIPYHEKKLGQLFCDGSAKAIVELLEKDARGAGAEFHLNTEIEKVYRTDSESSDGVKSVFVVETTTGEKFSAESLVIATGGFSLPKVGATGIGYRLARQFGLNVVETDPALDGFTLEGSEIDSFRSLSGVSIDVNLSAGGLPFRENILFTHTGMSGPASLQASLHWRKGEKVTADFLPDLADPFQYFKTKKAEGNRSLLKSLLAELVPTRFSDHFCETYFPSANGLPLPQISEAKLKEFCDRLKAFSFIPAGTVGYSKAEVTRGGVDTDELSSKTLEAKKVPGLYFIGEVVDVTGWLGGYNFQWAWASGYAAGQVV